MHITKWSIDAPALGAVFSLLHISSLQCVAQLRAGRLSKPPRYGIATIHALDERLQQEARKPRGSRQSRHSARDAGLSFLNSSNKSAQSCKSFTRSGQ